MKKIILIGLAASTLLMSSCAKSYLETSPTDSTTTGQALSSVKNLEYAMMGVHRRIQSYDSAQNRHGYQSVMTAFEVASGVIAKQDRANGWWNSTYSLVTFNATTSNEITYYPYFQLYRVLKNVNEILVRIDDLYKLASTAEEKRSVRNIKGQCLGYRAFIFLQLGQIYAWRWEIGGQNTQLAVPLRVDDISTELIPRATLFQVYEQVEKDCAAALVLLEGDGKIDANIGVKYTVTPAMIKMVEARLAMIKGQYDKVIAAVEYIKLIGKYKIMTTAQYSSGWNSLVRNGIEEVIWGSWTGKENVGNEFATYYAYNSCNYGTSYIKTGPHFLDRRINDFIPSTDTRKALFLQDTPEQIAANMRTSSSYYSSRGWAPSSGTAIYPLISKKFLAETGTGTSSGDVVYFRLAEAYYMAAEAAYLKGDEGTAQNYLYETVKNYDTSYTKTKFSGEALLNAIRTYKRFDLYVEGSAWFDYKRTGEMIDRGYAGTNHNLSMAVIETYSSVDPATKKYFKANISRDILLNNPLLVSDNL